MRVRTASAEPVAAIQVTTCAPLALQLAGYARVAPVIGISSVASVNQRRVTGTPAGDLTNVLGGPARAARAALQATTVLRVVPWGVPHAPPSTTFQEPRAWRKRATARRAVARTNARPATARAGRVASPISTAQPVARVAALPAKRPTTTRAARAQPWWDSLSLARAAACAFKAYAATSVDTAVRCGSVPLAARPTDPALRVQAGTTLTR
jgi:hypothetical protein